MLWRALRHVEAGFYIDVGANDPISDSVTAAFYERGWRGINIEPMQQYHLALSQGRPRDTNLCLAVDEHEGRKPLFVLPGTGLSTLFGDIAVGHAAAGHEVQEGSTEVRTLAQVCRDHAPADIHFLKIDVEGAERAVLAGADFDAFRPWIVVVEATAPNCEVQTHAEWEPLLIEANYRPVWFDGLNRFYVAAEREELMPVFATPPNVFDKFVRYVPPAPPAFGSGEIVAASYACLLGRDPKPKEAAKAERDLRETRDLHGFFSSLERRRRAASRRRPK